MRKVLINVGAMIKSLAGRGYQVRIKQTEADYWEVELYANERSTVDLHSTASGKTLLEALEGCDLNVDEKEEA